MSFIMWCTFNVNWITPIYCASSIKILNWIEFKLLGKSVHSYKSRSKAIVYDFVEKVDRQRITTDCKIEIVTRFDTDYFFIESFKKQ